MDAPPKLVSKADLTTVGIVLSAACLGLLEIAKITFCLFLVFYAAHLVWCAGSRLASRRSRYATGVRQHPA